MSDWVNVALVNDFPTGERMFVTLDDVRIVVFNLSGEFYAIEDICTHDGGELASGELEGDEIICPRHGARFCIRTGEVTKPPAYEGLDTFPVRIEQGMVQVKDDRWD